MRDRHPALDGFLGKRNHFLFLGGDGRGQKIPASGEREFVPALFIVRSKDVVHQTAYHDGLGLFETGTLELFDDHCFSLSVSMAFRITLRAASSSAREPALPVRFTTSQ